MPGSRVATRLIENIVLEFICIFEPFSVLTLCAIKGDLEVVDE